MLQKNKTKEDFSLETWPLLIGLKSLRKMLKKRLVVGLINFNYWPLALASHLSSLEVG